MIPWSTPPADPTAELLAEAQGRPLPCPVRNGEIEEMALLARLRPMIRRPLSPGQADERLLFFRQRGLAAEALPQAGGGLVLLASWGDGPLRQAIAAGGAPARERGRALGALLGIPGCCVEAHADALADGAPRLSLLTSALARSKTHGSPWLNTLDPALFRLVPWEPCSFTCLPSLDHAQRLVGLLKPHFRPFLRAIHRSLSCARLYFHDEVQLSMEGEARDDGFWPRLVYPTARDWPPGRPLSPEAQGQVAQALGVVRQARRVSTREGLITLDGAPLAPGLLARFSA